MAIDGDAAGMTPTAVLHAAEATALAARRVEVEQLELLLAWADLHSGDPQDEPNAIPVRYGGPKLITLGGDGTPGVVDLCLVEIAVARHESVHTTRNTLADALDLRHRLPHVWAGVQNLTCPVWVARKIARLARTLTADQAVLVDLAVADALDQSPGRLLEIAEAKIIEADPAAHEDRQQQAARRRGVWLHRNRSGERLDEPGLATLVARVEQGDAEALDTLVADLATALAEHAETPANGEAPPHHRPLALRGLRDARRPRHRPRLPPPHH